MVFDPLSVIGYVGVGMGVINFFFSTVSNIVRFYDELNLVNTRLNDHRAEFYLAELRLEAWINTWCRSPHRMRQEDYQYFWGEKGFQHVEDRFNEIVLAMDEIGRTLYSIDFFDQPPGQARLTKFDWQSWEEQLRQRSGNTRADPKWFRRLAFTLGHMAILEERLARLNRCTSQLIQLSDKSLKRRGFRRVEGEITHATLTQILDHQSRFNEYGGILTNLHNFITNVDDAWSLVLRSPEPGIMLDSGEKHLQTKVEFDVRINRKNVGIVTFRPAEYRARYTQPRDWYQAEVAGCPPCQGRSEQPLRTLFERRPLSTFGFEDIAWGLANWTLLLWETPWMDGICTCQIRIVMFDYNPLATFTASPQCQKDQISHLNRRALLLGVSLAELAIKRPIVVRVSSNGTVVFVDGRVQISEDDLLNAVAAGRKRVAFKRAVEYCFWYDKELQRVSRKFHPDDILHFEEGVLKE